MIPTTEHTAKPSVLNAISAMAKCRTKLDFADGILPDICKLVSARSAVMHYYASNTHQDLYYDPLYVNVDAKYIGRFQDGASDDDPFPGEALRRTQAGEGYAFGSHQLVDMKAFITSSFYLNFLRPQKIHFMLIIVVIRGDEPFAFLGLHRDEHSSLFSDEDIALANTLAPHLSAMADRVYMADALALYERAVDTLSFGQMNKGLLILDHNLSLVFANDYARSAFSSRVEFDPKIRYLPHQIVTACQALIDRGKSLTNMSSENFVLERREPRIEGYVRVNGAASEERFFLALFNSDEFGKLNPRAVEAFGLTKREIEVTQRIIEGKRNSEVAEELFISVRTVQNHLRSIYEKCEVNNRMSLSHRVLSLL